MRARTPSLFAAAALLAVAIVSPSVHARRHHRAACDVNSCTVVAAVEDACSCSTAETHGKYVHCVAHAGKQLATDAVIPRYCRGRLVRAAAHSVCGRADAVPCVAPVSTCDVDGFCVNDPNVECIEDADCGTQCTTTTSDGCDAVNGVQSDAPSCATESCFSPSGAFVDGPR